MSLLHPVRSALERVLGSSSRTRTLVAGTVAVGALVATKVWQGLKRGTQSRSPLPDFTLSGTSGHLELVEGHALYRVREGEGTPIVLLPALHISSGSFELAPLYEILCATTNRPVYVMDWLGFGYSERPDRRYFSGLYQRQLRRFLSEIVQNTSDIIAFGLACEYAAAVAMANPVLARRLVLVSPTGMTSRRDRVRRFLFSIAGDSGAFGLLYQRATSREELKAWYQRHVFDTLPMPDALLDLAEATTRVEGADHAPRRLADGDLYMNAYASRCYAGLKMPSAILLPRLTNDVAPLYEHLPGIAKHNANLTIRRLDSGIFPHLTHPEEFLALLLELGILPEHAKGGVNEAEKSVTNPA